MSQKSVRQVQAAVAEAAGTFILVLVVELSSRAGLAPFIAIGFCLAVLIFSMGHISGGHYNPAVSFAHLVAGKLSFMQTAVYMAAQVGGGLIGSLLALSMSLDASAPTPGRASHPQVAAFYIELIYSLGLAFVVLGSAGVKEKLPNSFFGLSIGLFVLGGISAAAQFSGAGTTHRYFCAHSVCIALQAARI